MTKSAGEDGFDEIGQPRFGEGDSLAAYTELYGLVLSIYGYRCVLTGEQFQRSPALTHPDLEVVAIRRREAGGPLAIDNYLPMILPAARAFRAGQLIIADDYTVIADFTVISDDLVRRLRPDGRLVLPVETLFRPGAEHLAFHRRSVLGT